MTNAGADCLRRAAEGCQYAGIQDPDGGRCEHYAFIERFREPPRSSPAPRSRPIDGVRADYKDGFGLVRCSNTTPCLVLRFDAEQDRALTASRKAFRGSCSPWMRV
jgi:phosphomannomutase